MDLGKSDNLATSSGEEKATDDNGANINSGHDASIFDISVATDNAANPMVEQESQKLPPFQEILMSPTQYEGIYELTSCNNHTYFF